MKTIIRHAPRGLGIIQVIIALIVLGVLGMAGYWQYNKQIRKEKFSEVVRFTAPYKDTLEKCFVDQRNTFLPCKPGWNGLPRIPDYYPGKTAKLVVNLIDQYHASITATAMVGGAMAGETYTIDVTAKVHNNQAVFEWSTNKQSTCLAAGIC